MSFFPPQLKISDIQEGEVAMFVLIFSFQILFVKNSDVKFGPQAPVDHLHGLDGIKWEIKVLKEILEKWRFVRVVICEVEKWFPKWKWRCKIKCRYYSKSLIIELQVFCIKMRMNEVCFTILDGVSLSTCSDPVYSRQVFNTHERRKYQVCNFHYLVLRFSKTC